jgi:hypothetical protein
MRQRCNWWYTNWGRSATNFWSVVESSEEWAGEGNSIGTPLACSKYQPEMLQHHHKDRVSGIEKKRRKRNKTPPLMRRSSSISFFFSLVLLLLLGVTRMEERGSKTLVWRHNCHCTAAVTAIGYTKAAAVAIIDRPALLPFLDSPLVTNIRHPSLLYSF